MYMQLCLEKVLLKEKLLESLNRLSRKAFQLIIDLKQGPNIQYLVVLCSLSSLDHQAYFHEI
jgi:hypothetical protein